MARWGSGCSGKSFGNLDLLKVQGDVDGVGLLVHIGFGAGLFQVLEYLLLAQPVEEAVRVIGVERLACGQAPSFADGRLRVDVQTFDGELSHEELRPLI